MKGTNVIFTLALILVILGLVVSRIHHEPRTKEAFDRHPQHLVYTQHARCRMECRHISEEDISEIMNRGIINFSKSDRNDRPCPTFALQGRTNEGERLRVIFAQCPTETKVVTCYNLDEDPPCSCPSGSSSPQSNRP